MTPLAHAITVEMTKPIGERKCYDAEGRASQITDFHCFECSEIAHLAADLASRHALPSEGRLAFLPAPRTWLEISGPACEFIAPFATRLAVLLEQEGDRARISLAILDPKMPGPWLTKTQGWLPLHAAPDLGSVVARRGMEHSAALQLAGQASLIYALLALINSPRVVGRVTRLPHAALQRRLAAAKGLSGKFPLHATIEMKLHVCERVLDERGRERVTWLSGEKALHWCRAYVRIQGGVLVYVEGHWRGNCANGMRNTRYKMLPPRSGRAA